MKNENKAKKLSIAIGEIGDDLISDAGKRRKKPARPPYGLWIAAGFLVMLVLTLPQVIKDVPMPLESTEPHTGVTVEPTSTSDPIPGTTDPWHETTGPRYETTEPWYPTTGPWYETTDPWGETTDPWGETTDPWPETTDPWPETTVPS